MQMAEEYVSVPRPNNKIRKPNYKEDINHLSSPHLQTAPSGSARGCRGSVEMQRPKTGELGRVHLNHVDYSGVTRRGTAAESP